MSKVTLHPGDNRLCRKTVTSLLGQCEDDLFSYLEEGVNCDTTLGYDPVGKFFYSLKSGRRPIQPGAGAILRIQMKDADKPSHNGVRCLGIPIPILCRPIMNNWVYRIGFAPATDDAEKVLLHPSFSPFRVNRGYIGMTSRERPMDRFDEHFQKMRSGKGHLLHKAWRSLIAEADVMVNFHIVAALPTRQAAFDLEEKLVDEIGTISPNGLNVIAGGMKGIRELWRLGLMAKAEKPTDDRRDAALDLLESDRSPVTTHYRSGHIRKLNPKCKAATTWVSPCWVGLKEAAA